MPWQDRIREAAYTSPGGVRTVFTYEDVRNEIDKKTTGFEFPDAEGTFVQDLGHSGRRYPLRVIFWGDDYDLESNAFDASLLERGIGKLEHPIYGTVDVVPFGTISRRDNLKTASNQAIIEVTFWETIGLVYPSPQGDPGGNVLASVAEYNGAAAEEFANTTDLTGAVEKATFKDSYQKLLDRTKQGLQKIADTQADVQKQFDTINDSINSGIDALISEPLNLGFQTVLMIQSPARALALIQARLDAYNNLAQSVISGDGAVSKKGKSGSNQFRGRDLYVSTYVTGSIISTVNNNFVTKGEALAAAESVLTQFDNVVAWRDDNFKSLEEIDQGVAYQKLQESVALTAGFLVEISFSLKQERRVTLDRAHTVIDLVAELYGTVDEELDFFINSNSLTGSEILELPRGREIAYYV